MKIALEVKLLVVASLSLFLVTSVAGKRARRHKNRKEFRVKDCGKDPDRPIHINDLAVTPMPVRIPGKARVWTTLNITEDLPKHMGVHVYVKKYTNKHGLSFPMPCGAKNNPCYHKDICSIIQAYYTERCPNKLRSQGFNCKCPVKEGVYRIDKLRFPLPDVPEMYKIYVEGKYDLKLEIFDETNKREIGCVQLRFYVQRRTSNEKRLFTLGS